MVSLAQSLRLPVGLLFVALGLSCSQPSADPAPTAAPTAAPVMVSPSPYASPFASPYDASPMASPFAGSPAPLGQPLEAPAADVTSPPPEAPVSPLPAPSGPPPDDKTLRLQVLLDRAHFSPGEIDGRDGGNTRLALASYKRERGARGAGAAAAPDLESDTTPFLVDYTVTSQDVAGPFTPDIPEDMMAKAELPALAYKSALEALAERFHASPSLLQKLNPQATFQRAGERLRVPNVHTEAPGKAASIVVDGSGPWVAAMDAQGRALAVYPATAGSQHDPLPLGKWKVNGVSRNPTFNYNPDLFWDAEAGHAKAKIPAGPNNPVGVVWIDLSKPHYGIHGTPEPSTVSKTQSHGCIRLTNWDAEELAGMVSPGAPVVIRK
jgi:lipoprotein-anchoring transpeptidase ErfK/SrfK